MPLDGFKMQTAGAMCVTHTMSLEQLRLERLVDVGRRTLHLHLPEGPSPGHLGRLACSASANGDRIARASCLLVSGSGRALGPLGAVTGYRRRRTGA